MLRKAARAADKDPGLPDYDRGNQEAAAVILADVEKYGGEEAGLVRWARLWASRHMVLAAKVGRGENSSPLSVEVVREGGRRSLKRIVGPLFRPGNEPAESSPADVPSRPARRRQLGLFSNEGGDQG